jgi:DNA invertase Pin-like site-specific DNA recombinase
LTAEPFLAGPRFVSYLRLFPNKPGNPSLDLEAQRAIVRRYLADGDRQVVQEFVEIETGKKRGARPQLTAAFGACRAHDVGLIIAALGRIGGNLPLIAGLIESGIDFVAADNPRVNRSTIPLLAAVAEEEMRVVSERTKAALAAAKARGVKLGNPNGARALRGRQIGNEAAVAAIKSKAQRDATKTHALIQAVIAERGTTTLAVLAKLLNERGVPTPRGGLWYPTSVKLVLDRFKPSARAKRGVERRSYRGAAPRLVSAP